MHTEIRRRYEFHLRKDGTRETKLENKVDIILSINSIFPQNFIEFDLMIKNLIFNLKKNGKILMVLPSLESETFFYQIKTLVDSENNENILEDMKKLALRRNFNPFGHTVAGLGYIQKHWLKEELEFRFKLLSIKNYTIKKLELDWFSQMKEVNLDFKDMPKCWYWFIEINKEFSGI